MQKEEENWEALNTKQLNFTADRRGFTVTLTTLLIFAFYLGFLSHTTRERTVPVCALSKVRRTQLGKVLWSWLEKAVYWPHFALPNTLFVISTFIEVNLVHYNKKQTNLKQSQLRKSHQTDII